jgi:hypothetical protein
MTSLRGKLSYANVVATLALVLAVAGIPSAVAITASKVKKNSISGAQIKKGTIRASNIKPGAITADKIADGNVTASKLAGIHHVSTRMAPAGPVVEAVCAPGEVLLSGGTNAEAGNVTTSLPDTQQIPPRWRSVTLGGSGTDSDALCLKATPGG